MDHQRWVHGPKAVGVFGFGQCGHRLLPTPAAIGHLVRVQICFGCQVLELDHAAASNLHAPTAEVISLVTAKAYDAALCRLGQTEVQRDSTCASSAQPTAATRSSASKHLHVARITATSVAEMHCRFSYKC